MINAKIDISDLISKINSLSTPELVQDIGRAVANEAVVPELAKYPPQTHAKQPFRSDKSRRFFFAAVKSGQLQVPYRRSGRGGQTEVLPTANGADVVVPAEYSDLIRTRGQQAKYHQGNWEDTEMIAQRIQNDIAEVIATAHVIAALEKAGLT